MTDQPDLVALTATWQKRLGLSDWTIDVDYGSPFTLGRDERAAEVSYETAMRHAKIQLLRPEHIDPGSIAPYDLEESLLHELLHLHLWPFSAPPQKTKGVLFEQAINAIAHALITLARETTHADDAHHSPA